MIKAFGGSKFKTKSIAAMPEDVTTAPVPPFHVCDQWLQARRDLDCRRVHNHISPSRPKL